MSRYMSLNDVPSIEPYTDRVEVPEFGFDAETEEPLSVIVRSLTLHEHNVLYKQAWELNVVQTEDDGVKPSIKAREEYDEATIVTGWCAIDEDENLVFGVDKEDAVERVKALHVDYREAIRRIHRRCLELSGLREEKTDKKEKPIITPDKAVERAEKN